LNVEIIMAIVIALIVAPVGLAIGATVTYSVVDSLAAPDNYASDTMDNIRSNTGTGYNLASLLPLVIGAVGIIAIIVFGFLGVAGAGRREGPRD
jgi:hypothetical protein